jgi:hypothetical protein
MHATTPVGDTRTDLTTDTTARHGDIDRNGDLVDVLRLRAAITAASPAAEEEQLRAVRAMLRRGPGEVSR